MSDNANTADFIQLSKRVGDKSNTNTSMTITGVRWTLVAQLDGQFVGEDGTEEFIKDLPSHQPLITTSFARPILVEDACLIDFGSDLNQMAQQAIDAVAAAPAAHQLAHELRSRMNWLGEFHDETFMMEVPVRVTRQWDIMVPCSVQRSSIAAALSLREDPADQADILARHIEALNDLATKADEMIKNGEAGDYDACESGCRIMISSMDALEGEFSSDTERYRDALSNLKLFLRQKQR